MIAAEGIRIGAGAGADGAIPGRSVPEIQHEVFASVSTASDGAGSEMPTWTSILEALGLTAQTPDANIAMPSETLPPPSVGSAQASDNTGRLELSKDEGAQDGEDSKGLKLSPRLIREARLHGPAAPSRSRRCAETLQTETPQKGNSKQCGGGPEKEQSLSASQLAIVLNIPLSPAAPLQPQTPQAEPGGSANAMGI